MDRVRGLNLEPRFPHAGEPAGGGGSGATANRALVYYGSPAGASAGRPGALPGTGEGVDLNFENTPVTAVAKVILGDILGVGYTIDPRVQGTISLSSGRPVPKANLLFVLESALRASNAVLAHDAGGYRILPADDAIGSGGADRAGRGHELEPGYGVTAIPLQHVSAATMTKLLEGFAAKAGAIRADPAANLILVIGNGIERRTAVETVLSFDADWMRGQSVGIFPIVNTTPEPLIAELEKILDSGEGGLSQSMVKLQPVGHLNAVLVVARKPELLRAAATWIGRLDGSPAMSTGVKVYRVRYGDARQIAKSLNDLLGGGGGGGLDQAADQLAPGAGATTLSASAGGLGGGAQGQGQGQGSSPFGSLGSASGQGGSGSGQGGGGLGGGGSGGGGLGGSGSGFGSGGPFGGRPALAGASAGFGAGGGGVGGAGGGLLPGVKITADVINNAILIYANQEHYRIVEKALQQIDRPQAQVAIDVTVAEVHLTNELQYGVQFFLGSINTLHSFSNGVQTSNTAGLTPPPPNGSFPGFNLVVGSKLTPHVVLSALDQYTTTKILSNPSLVVVDNQNASLLVGQQVPVTTGNANILNSATTTSNTVFSSIQYQDTGIVLHIHPRIYANGNVNLEIVQEISSVDLAAGNNNCNGGPCPTFNNRKVKSSILAADGQTVLLAGLIQDNQTRSRNGIPVLDQIPVLGEAFVNNADKKLDRIELIIFIRPQIIRDGVDASFVAEELRSKIRGDKIGSLRPPGAIIPNPPPMIVK